MENRVSYTIPAEDLKQIKEAIAVLQTKLDPNLLSLTIQGRKDLNKMGEASRPFVGKVMEYIETNPEFKSPYNKPEEMNKDWTLINQLGPIYNVLNQTVSNLDDTLMEAGAELLDQANKYYGSVQIAAKDGMANSKKVYEGLAVRYEKRAKRRGGDPAGV
ncbi:hypothetical protein D0X99_10890 [Algoriphagus lacus]|uniref:Uncharacterized protein n=1 Tax=Algoriphagus lacus TaxID=2056311 RepID=A0A418PSR8_9BACT|nr:hypothetical protein [Algoriphagus lacus]RIW15916.1 hypothetical protein D0X99_10890 [Algoriphagus lacus]